MRAIFFQSTSEVTFFLLDEIQKSNKRMVELKKQIISLQN